MWHKVHKAGQKCISIEGKRLGRLPPFENAQWGKVNLPPPAANQIFVGAGSTARYIDMHNMQDMPSKEILLLLLLTITYTLASNSEVSAQPSFDNGIRDACSTADILVVCCGLQVVY